MTDTNSEPDFDDADLVHWSPRHGPSFGQTGPRTASVSPLAIVAVGAAAAGALAVGAMAIGALAVGRLAVGQARFKTVRIGRLVVDEWAVKDRSDTA